jgi:hypothetical protein
MYYICGTLKINNMKIRTMVLYIIVAAFILQLLPSCKTSGYGCKGRESWGQMIKRNNRPY